MNVRIVVDSTTDLPEKLRPSFTVVPLSVRFGDEEFIDGVTISHREFYEKLIESDVLPTTSQPTPDAFAQVYRQAEEAGEEVVVLTISSKLSGTYQSAVIAAEEFPGRVFVVDSCSAALGAAILAELALGLARQGMPAREIAVRLEEERANVRLVAMLDTLEYLKKGGRLSGAAAFAGELLSIKPVISLDGGEIVVRGKARGSRRGNNLLVKEIENCGGVDFSRPVLLGYSGLSDLLLQKYIEDSAHLWKDHVDDLRATQIGSVIGTHAGPGAIAAAFFSRQAD